MAFGNRKGKGPGGRSHEPLSANDLILLGRHEEAENLLMEKLAADPGDDRAQLQLADLFATTGRSDRAVGRLMGLGKQYSKEGLFDKALAVYRKAERILPGHAQILTAMVDLNRSRDLEHKRGAVVSALERIAKEVGGGVSGAAFVEVGRLWSGVSMSPVVEALDASALQRLFTGMHLRRLKEGEVLVSLGEEREEIFIIVQGELEARVGRGDAGEMTIKSLGPGQLIGDRALLEHRAWPATIRASQRCTLLSLDAEGLQRAMQGSSDPRALLDALRAERLDHQIAESAGLIKRA